LKAAAKASKAEVTAARRAAACARIEAMSAEEKAAWRDAKAKKQAARRSAANAKAARLAAAYAPGAPVPHVLIDLCEEYTALMTPRERTSLASQLRACYAANAGSAHPLRLTFAGWSAGWAAALGGPASGMHAWRVGLEEGDFASAAAAAAASASAGGGKGGEKIVYLSADGEEELSALEPGVSYIIGGLVDRNRHKGVAARRAGGFPGVRAARLPIGAHAALAASAVLTVDQVCRLLVTWWSHKQDRKGQQKKDRSGDGSEEGGGGDGGEDEDAACWAVAVREAVPARKMVGGGGGGGGGGGDGGE
jgi:tRNA (guanine9-N1)-methyltransferase